MPVGFAGLGKENRLSRFKVMELLFKLLRNALWGTIETIPRSLSGKELEQLLAIAEEQTVSGLVIGSLIRNDVRMPQKWVFEIVGKDAQNKQANQKLNNGLKQLVNLPLKDYVVVKGQTIAAIYPDVSLRMPGDIDFLVYDYDEAKGVIEREWGIELPKKLIDREYAFEHCNATYEIHDNLITFGSREHQQYWGELMKRPYVYMNVEGVQVPTLEPTFNAIYVFIHLFFHFLREGVSLRQLCDWAMVLNHYREGIIREDLLEQLEKLDLIKAYRAFGTVIVDELGLPSDEFPFALNCEDRKWKEKILKDIFKGGNFGKLNHQAQSSWRFKLETMMVALRNSFKYYRLCPSEVGWLIPRLGKLNLKLLKA